MENISDNIYQQDTKVNQQTAQTQQQVQATDTSTTGNKTHPHRG